jgi:hypothetical protein
MGRDRLAQQMESVGRRSMPMGPPPPTGVASYGVAPEGGESSIQAMEGTPEDRTRMEEAMAAATERGANFDQPQRFEPDSATGIQGDRMAAVMEQQRRQQRMPGRGPGMGRAFGRGRGPVY